MAEQSTLKKYNATYTIRVPPAIVRLIGWEEGMALDINISPPNNLIISPAIKKVE
jgi:hypothetical protein